MKDELVNSLERTFKPKYIPILSEFEFSLGAGFDFEKEFDNLIEPLLDKKLLVKKDDTFILTKEGQNRNSIWRNSPIMKKRRGGGRTLIAYVTRGRVELSV